MPAGSRSSRGSTARPSHETVRRALRALANLEHRGASGADADTGDGAGILLQIPDRLFRDEVEGSRSRAATASASSSCPHERRAPGRARGARRADGRRRRAAIPLLAGRAGRPLPGRHGLRRGRAADPPGGDRRRRGPRGRRVRAEALRDPARRRARRRAGSRRAEPLLADARLQGDAHGAAARALLPRPRRPARRDGARPRPLPLLDEHVPELGARAPLPRDRAQRRDQHAARERQLDARARVAARVGALRRRPRRRCCRSSGPAAPTPRRSTTCSSCSCSPAARCRTR